jgi:hypothetical protein
MAPERVEQIAHERQKCDHNNVQAIDHFDIDAKAASS